MQSSSQSKAAADLATSTSPAGDNTLTPVAAAKSNGKMLAGSKAKSTRSSEGSAALNKTEASVDGDQLDKSSVADLTADGLASKKTSPLDDGLEEVDSKGGEATSSKEAMGSRKRKLSEITGGHDGGQVSSKRLKLSPDSKGAKEAEETVEEPKPESETKGSQKVEAADSSKPEKSELPAEASAEGTANSGDKQEEPKVEPAPAEEAKQEPEVVQHAADAPDDGKMLDDSKEMGAEAMQELSSKVKALNMDDGAKKEESGAASKEHLLKDSQPDEPVAEAALSKSEEKALDSKLAEE